MKKTVLILVVFCGLAFMSFAKNHVLEQNQNSQVLRPDKGQGQQTMDLTYRLDGEQEEHVEIDVREQAYTAAEAESLLEDAVEQWYKQYLGDNPSEEHVQYNLILPVSLCQGQVQVRYESSNYQILHSDGEIDLKQVKKDGDVVELTAIFSCSTYSRIEKIGLWICHPDPRSKEGVREALEEKLMQEEEKSRENVNLELPTQVAGHSIEWIAPKDNSWMVFIFLGIITAFCLQWKKKEDEKRRRKERRQQLLWEYPKMVEQLALLLGSGMTIRRAWEKMTQMSERNEKAGICVRPVFVEEMEISMRELKEGYSEMKIYDRFGKRIGLLPYRRLGSILSQNLSKGTMDIQSLLQREAFEAMEMRKNQAKRKGEEAGTKMLFPMLVMLVLVLMVLILPAATTLGGVG